MNLLKKHEKEIYKRIVYLLKKEPENFSAKWFTGETLDNSVKYLKSSILISKNGNILDPKIDINVFQKIKIRKLISSIIEIDSKELLDKYLNQIIS